MESPAERYKAELENLAKHVEKTSGPVAAANLRQNLSASSVVDHLPEKDKARYLQGATEALADLNGGISNDPGKRIKALHQTVEILAKPDSFAARQTLDQNIKALNEDMASLPQPRSRIQSKGPPPLPKQPPAGRNYEDDIVVLDDEPPMPKKPVAPAGEKRANEPPPSAKQPPKTRNPEDDVVVLDDEPPAPKKPLATPKPNTTPKVGQYQDPEKSMVIGEDELPDFLKKKVAPLSEERAKALLRQGLNSAPVKDNAVVVNSRNEVELNFPKPTAVNKTTGDVKLPTPGKESVQLQTVRQAFEKTGTKANSITETGDSVIVKISQGEYEKLKSQMAPLKQQMANEPAKKPAQDMPRNKESDEKLLTSKDDTAIKQAKMRIDLRTLEAAGNIRPETLQRKDGSTIGVIQLKNTNPEQAANITQALEDAGVKFNERDSKSKGKVIEIYDTPENMAKFNSIKPQEFDQGFGGRKQAPDFQIRKLPNTPDQGSKNRGGVNISQSPTMESPNGLSDEQVRKNLLGKPPAAPLTLTPAETPPPAGPAPAQEKPKPQAAPKQAQPGSSILGTSQNIAGGVAGGAKLSDGLQTDDKQKIIVGGAQLGASGLGAGADIAGAKGLAKKAGTVGMVIGIGDDVWTVYKIADGTTVIEPGKSRTEAAITEGTGAAANLGGNLVTVGMAGNAPKVLLQGDIERGKKLKALMDRSREGKLSTEEFTRELKDIGISDLNNKWEALKATTPGSIVINTGEIKKELDKTQELNSQNNSTKAKIFEPGVTPNYDDSQWRDKPRQERPMPKINEYKFGNDNIMYLKDKYKDEVGKSLDGDTPDPKILREYINRAIEDLNKEDPRARKGAPAENFGEFAADGIRLQKKNLGESLGRDVEKDNKDMAILDRRAKLVALRDAIDGNLPPVNGSMPQGYADRINDINQGKQAEEAKLREREEAKRKQQEQKARLDAEQKALEEKYGEKGEFGKESRELQGLMEKQKARLEAEKAREAADKEEQSKRKRPANAPAATNEPEQKINGMSLRDKAKQLAKGLMEQVKGGKKITESQFDVDGSGKIDTPVERELAKEAYKELDKVLADNPELKAKLDAMRKNGNAMDFSESTQSTNKVASTAAGAAKGQVNTI